MPLARIQVPGPIQAQYLLRGLAPIGVGNRPGSAPSAWLPARLSARLPARLPEWLPGSLLARRSRQHSALFPGEGLRRLPARVWDPCLGPMSGTRVWDPCLGPLSLALAWPYCGPRILRLWGGARGAEPDSCRRRHSDMHWTPHLGVDLVGTPNGMLEGAAKPTPCSPRNLHDLPRWRCRRAGAVQEV